MDNNSDLLEKNKKKIIEDLKEIRDFFNKYKEAWFKNGEIELGSVSFEFDRKYILDCGENECEYKDINDFIKEKLGNVFDEIEKKQEKKYGKNDVKAIIFQYNVDENKRIIFHKMPILHNIDPVDQIFDKINLWLPVCHSITHKFKEGLRKLSPWKYGIENDENIEPVYCLIWIYEKVTINDIDNSSGYLTINFIYNGDKSNHSFKSITDDLVKYAMPLLQSFAMNKINDFFIKESRKQAKKAAKAGIVSRNMSHNLGSHVLSYLHTRLKEDNTVYEIKESLLLEAFTNTKISPSEPQLEITFPTFFRDKVSFDFSDKRKKPFIFGLSSFVSYLQDRQDFIATIATSYNPFLSTVNFKDFIFDEINLDYKQKRHTNLDEQENILLKYIALSEGVKRDDISIKFRSIDGQENEDSIIESGYSQKRDDFFELRKLNLDLPGGIIGTQAIFSILENILRNEAKHCIRNRNVAQADNKDTSKSNYLLDFEIDITDSFKNPVLSNETLKNSINTIKNDFYEFSIKSKAPIAFHDRERIKLILNNAIKDGYIDDYALLTEGNKGIKEMRISAAWLRNEDVSEIDDEINIPGKPPILSVDIDNNGFLTYYFYVLKPKKVCGIKKDIKIKPEDISKLNEKGWYFYDSVDKLTNNASNYRFYITDSYDTHEEILKNISIRSLKVDGSFFEDLSNENEESKLIELEVKWNEIIRNKRNLTILLDDDIYNSEKFDAVFKNGQNLGVLDKNDTSLKDIVNVELLRSPENIGNLILYRTHNDLMSEFSGFKTSTYTDDLLIYNNSIFIEGISGGNSTDRIMRHDILTKKDQPLLYEFNPLWYYHIIESSLATVLIIDERLHHEKSKDSSNCELNQIIYHKKRIHIINFEYNNEEKIFEIKDIGGTKLGTISKTIVSNKASINLKWETERTVEKPFFGVYAEDTHNICYDFITIHQGLIDKLKTVFNVDKNSISIVLTNEMHPKRLIVHSGRSKPSPDDLPINVAFVQWASLTKAFYDCKQTLTDLLYSLKIVK